jgi:peptidoglycan/xylan/chitin deacetylase (PgdA/CDA1 family)
MPSRVLLTVDTELTWGDHARGVGWRENLARSFDPAGVGVPHQLQLLREHGLKACFFVDPMPALVYGIEPIRRMVEPILAAGQEVQLHIHPVWRGVSDGKKEGGLFELSHFDAARQQSLIEEARDLLIEAGAPPPIAFRAGSYAANPDTLAALRSLGIPYDSSHNGSHHPLPSSLPLDREQIVPVECEGVIEVPLGQIEAAPGKLRHLQLCAVSTVELEAALDHASANDHPVTTIVSHSFELATRDGLRPNRSVCLRFERLCAFLRDNRERLPTAFFADLADVPLGQPASPLPSRRLRTAGRMVEQLWANARYERRL